MDLLDFNRTALLSSPSPALDAANQDLEVGHVPVILQGETIDVDVQGWPNSWRDQEVFDYMLHMELNYEREHYYLKTIDMSSWIWETAKAKVLDVERPDVTPTRESNSLGFHSWLSSEDHRYDRCEYGSPDQYKEGKDDKDDVEVSTECMWKKMIHIAEKCTLDSAREAHIDDDGIMNYVYEVSQGYSKGTCENERWNGPLTRLLDAEGLINNWMHSSHHRDVLISQNIWSDFWGNWISAGAKVGNCRSSIFFTLGNQDMSTGVCGVLPQ